MVSIYCFYLIIVICLFTAVSQTPVKDNQLTLAWKEISRYIDTTTRRLHNKLQGKTVCSVQKQHRQHKHQLNKEKAENKNGKKNNCLDISSDKQQNFMWDNLDMANNGNP